MPVKTKTRARKGDITRLAIEDAAIELFMEQGYHATSIRQIAERAGLALGGIYNHFGSKDEIFAAIIVDQHPYQKILPLVLAVEGETAEEFFRNAFQIILEELGKQPEFINLMFIEIVEFRGRHAPKLLHEMAPKVLPIFERIVKSKRDLRVTNPAMLMRSFFGMILSYFITEMLISDSVVGKLMPRDSSSVYIDLFLKGILKESA